MWKCPNKVKILGKGGGVQQHFSEKNILQLCKYLKKSIENKKLPKTSLILCELRIILTSSNNGLIAII